MTTFELDETAAPIAVIRPVGRLNTSSAPDLTSMIIEVVAAGRPRVVIDLSGTESIDSSGLSSLVASLKRCRRAGGDLRLAAPSPGVTSTLKLTNLNLVLESSESVHDACARI